MSPHLFWTLSPGVLIGVGARRRRLRQRAGGRCAGRPLRGARPRRRYGGCAASWAPCSRSLIALISPLDALADQLFFMHMVQHMLLLDVVPILAILGLTKVILRPVTRAVRDLERRAGGSRTPPSRWCSTWR